MSAAAGVDMLGMSLRQRANQMAGPDTVVVARNAWIRNRRRTRVWAAIAVLWSLVFACLLFIPGDPQSHRTLGDYLGLGAFYFGIAALGMAFASRVAKAGVWIGPDGIEVRGPFRTRSVSIADAEVSFRASRGGRGTEPRVRCSSEGTGDRWESGHWVGGTGCSATSACSERSSRYAMSSTSWSRHSAHPADPWRQVLK
jgi:hypothetical protein